MEGLGQKFQQARAARNLTLDEAARMTKIRPSKLAEIEAEDFSQFPSLAYAKGFLLIYGKFLNVDVTPYLEAFETSEHVTVDGYSYLQDNPAPPPRRTEVVRHRPASGGGGGGGGRKTSLLPLVIGIVVLVAGFSLLRLMMDVRRLPSHQRDAQALAQASPTAPPTTNATAPAQALPVDPAAAPTAPAVAAASPASAGQPGTTAAAPIPTPGPEATVVAAATPAATAEEEPEVRRAEPVNPEDLVKAEAALAKTSPTPPGINRFDIRPLRKTFVRVIVDGGNGPAIERWLNVSEAPVQLRGQRIAVKVLDPGAVEIRKNGKIVSRGDADIRLE